MIVSYERQFLFIHTLRTGGTSIKTALTPYCVAPETLWENRLLRAFGIHVNYIGPRRRRWYRGHTTAEFLKQNLGDDLWESLLRFTVVRNPFDRLVSLYQHLQNPRLKKLTGRSIRRRVAFAASRTFEQFATDVADREEYLQASLVCDQQGNLMVDRVLRFESLADDFARLCAELDLDAKLVHVNQSRRKDYRQYYTDELIESLTPKIQQDLTTFGYEFDSAAPLQANAA